MMASLRTLFRRIFGTPPAAASAQPQTGYLVNVLSWLTLAGIVAALLFLLQGGGGRPATFALLLAGFFLLPCRVLLRRGRVAPAAAWLVAGYFIMATLGVARAGGLTPILYIAYLFTIVAATLVLGRRAGLITTTATIVVGFLTATLTGQTALQAGGAPQSPLALGALLALGAVLFSTLVYLSDESIARALQEAKTSAAELAQMKANLEGRVAEQTRDLRLAAEIGQTVAQIRDLDRLLERAVNLVRDRFDLYFVQIYLPESAGRTLVMRAGTGDVGRKLRERGHRLPLTLDSINGTAAAEKRVVIVADTDESTVFRPNDLLPLTRSEMAVPLIAADRVVGVINLQSVIPGTLSAAMKPVFEALAAQLAVAIENAGLFAAARGARDELAAQSRRLVDAGWRSFLDGIERREKLGFTYDRVAIFPVIDPEQLAVDEATIAAPISVAGREVGRIQVKTSKVDQLQAPDRELVEFVAQQVAQQIESLRLLAEAEKYRAEAESIVRQATRDAWDSFRAAHAVGGYVYDGQQVVGLRADGEGGEEQVSQPLSVLGEDIGEIALPAAALQSAEAAALVKTVAERLSVHLENLRLTQQTETALTQTEALYQGSDRVVRATSIHQTLEALVTSTALKYYDWCSVAFFDRPWSAVAPNTITIMSTYARDERQPMPAGLRPGTAYDAAVWAGVLQRNLPTLFEDITQSPEATPGILQVANALGLRSLVFFPLLAGDSWYGVVTGQARQPRVLGDDDIRRLNSLVDQAGAVIQGVRLLSDAQRRAEHERRVRAVTDKIRRGSDRDAILRIAREEIGQLLGTEDGRIHLGTKQQLLARLRGEDGNGERPVAPDPLQNGS